MFRVREEEQDKRLRMLIVAEQCRKQTLSRALQAVIEIGSSMETERSKLSQRISSCRSVSKSEWPGRECSVNPAKLKHRVSRAQRFQLATQQFCSEEARLGTEIEALMDDYSLICKEIRSCSNKSERLRLNQQELKIYRSRMLESLESIEVEEEGSVRSFVSR
jgi:hypothetical protein